MTEPEWWPLFRRTIVFLLGVAVIVDSLIEDRSTGNLVVGLLMVGVLPLDDLVRMIARNGKRHDDRP